MNDTLQTTLKALRLSGLAATLDVRLQEAASHGLNHAEFLELILQDELLVRKERLIERRIKAARFRNSKTLEDFEWSFNPAIKKKPLYDLAAGHFIREDRDVLLLGPPGVGKSHLCQAIGYAAIKSGFSVLYRSIFDLVRDFLHDEAFEGQDKVLARYLKPDLLIVDDMGMKHLPKRSGEYLFEVIMRRYETRSTMMTSNRPLEDWGKRAPPEGWSGDVPSATAILDRFPAPCRTDPKSPAKATACKTAPVPRRMGAIQKRTRKVKTDQSAHRVAPGWRDQEELLGKGKKGDTGTTKSRGKTPA